MPYTKDILSRATALLYRHVAALSYVLRIIVPILLKTGRGPILLSRMTGMGDIICTVPAARELVKRHPDAAFIYNCHADFSEVPRLAGIPGYVTSFEHIGLIGHWYAFLLGGFYHFSHRDDTQGQVAQEPMVTEFLRQFGLPLTDEHPRFNLDPDLLNRAKAILQGKGLDLAQLVIIHPGPSWPVREWPHEYWEELVQALHRHGFTSIAQLGVGQYVVLGKVALTPVRGAVSLIDALTLEEAFAVISLARLHVGIDSGLLHIAAAVGTPGVGIFGMTSPQVRFSTKYIRPFVVSQVECQGCYHRLPRVDWITNCPNGIKCMKMIKPAEVLNACLAELSAEKTASTNSERNGF